MKKILIVDDEQEIRELLQDFVEEMGFEVQIASDGKIGTQKALLIKPDLIISDIKMPSLNGIELLHWCSKNLSTTPIVLMSGFTDILLAEEAISLGAKDLIAKPFDFEALEGTIKNIFDSKKLAKSNFKDNIFYRLDIEKFVSGTVLPCSIFIKIRNDHYVKLAEKGNSVPKDDIERHKSKKLKSLYVLKEEYSNFLNFNFEILDRLKGNEDISEDKIVNFVTYTNELILEKTFVSELDNKSIEDVISYSNQALDILKDHTSLMKTLSDVSENSTYIYSHSLSTAIISYLIAKEIGWTREPTLFKVFLAGLLHDIGLKEVPKDLLEKNQALFTEDERKLYESHPVRGMEILNALGGIPEEVILASYQHHEDNKGTGYPLKKMKTSISQISRVVSVADVSCKKMIGDKKIGLEALRVATKKVLEYQKDYYDQDALEALCKIISLDIVKSSKSDKNNLG